jgi:hypothetical protein
MVGPRSFTARQTCQAPLYGSRASPLPLNVTQCAAVPHDGINCILQTLLHALFAHCCCTGHSHYSGPVHQRLHPLQPVWHSNADNAVPAQCVAKAQSLAVWVAYGHTSTKCQVNRTPTSIIAMVCIWALSEKSAPAGALAVTPVAGNA